MWSIFPEELKQSNQELNGRSRSHGKLFSDTIRFLFTGSIYILTCDTGHLPSSYAPLIFIYKSFIEYTIVKQFLLSMIFEHAESEIQQTLLKGLEGIRKLNGYAAYG